MTVLENVRTTVSYIFLNGATRILRNYFFWGFSTILYEKQTEFVQNASHELRTPLTIIQAKQELLLTEPNKKIIENKK